MATLSWLWVVVLLGLIPAVVWLFMKWEGYKEWEGDRAVARFLKMSDAQFAAHWKEQDRLFAQQVEASYAQFEEAQRRFALQLEWEVTGGPPVEPGGS